MQSMMDMALRQDMEPAADTREPEEIAQSINRIKQETMETVVRAAIRIGAELRAAKSKVPYGSWGDWLRDNVDYSERKAQEMMRLAEEYGKRSSRIIDELNLTQAVLLMGLPAGEREAFVESHNMDDMTTDQLRQQIAELNAEKAKAQMTIDDLTREAEHLREEAQAAAEAADDGRVEELESELQSTVQELKTIRDQLHETETRHAAAMRTAEGNAETERKRQKEAADKLREATEKLAVLERNRKRLEEELEAERSKPAAVEVVEQVPEDVAKELEDLRRKAAMGGDEYELRALFGSVKDAWRKLVDKLRDVQNHKDPGMAQRYKEAFANALEVMRGELENEHVQSN